MEFKQFSHREILPRMSSEDLRLAWHTFTIDAVGAIMALLRLRMLGPLTLTTAILRKTPLAMEIRLAV